MSEQCALAVVSWRQMFERLVYLKRKVTEHFSDCLSVHDTDDFSQVAYFHALGIGHACTLCMVFGPLKGIGADTGKRTDIEYGAWHAIACKSNCTGFPLWLRAKETGADLLWRACSQPHFPVKEAHEYGSWRSVFRGKGIDNSCEVRVIDYMLKQEDATVYRLVTNLHFHDVFRNDIYLNVN
ncbi:MAG: hypothetical protein OXE59_09190, partial [Bacteroidetes bacterium]|nr:hypothetical protein [Bacteroidota bacterium]